MWDEQSLERGPGANESQCEQQPGLVIGSTGNLPFVTGGAAACSITVGQCEGVAEVHPTPRGDRIARFKVSKILKSIFTRIMCNDLQKAKASD